MSNAPLLNLTLLACWIAAHHAPARWLALRLVSTEGALHLGVAGLAAGLLLREAARDDLVAALRRAPRVAVGPWALAVGLPLLSGLLPFRSLRAAAMLLSAYGLLSLYAGPGTWRRLRAAALLGAGALPLTTHLDVLLGLPLRVASAEVVARLYGGVASSTVLAVEGGYAHVDLPCSGVQSLWSAAIVLLAAAAAWGQPIGIRWLGALLGTWALAVTANTARIAALVGAHHQLGLPTLADVLHTPLGVIGFALALAPALLWLRLAPPPASPCATRSPPRRARPPLVVAAALCLGLVAAAPAHRAAPPADSGPPIRLDARWLPAAPTPAEAAFSAQHGATLHRATGAIGARPASVVAIRSRSWVAQHVPELCHRSGGWTLDADHAAWIDGAPVRWATLRRGDHAATALWWFQAPDGTTTDDATQRIVAGLLDPAPWVLVSVLVDGHLDATDPDLAPAVRGLRRDASAALTLEPR